MQIHWHHPDLDFASTFAQFHQLIEQGKVLHLGVTNFNTTTLKRALQYAPIQTHQVQYSLIDRRVEQSMQALCLQHGIDLLTYGALAGGFLSSRFLGINTPQNSPDHARSFYYSNMIREHGGWQPVLELLDTLNEIAQKYEKTIAEVALNWVKHQPGVRSVISGLTLDRQQIQQNVEALTWKLAAVDIEQLSARSSRLFEQSGDIYSYER